MNTKPFDRLDYVYKLLVVIALTIAGIVILRDLVIPVCFAALLSVMILPLVKRLERRIGTTWAIILVLLTVTIVLSLLGWLLVYQVVSLVNDLPNIETRFFNFIDRIQARVSETLDISTADQKTMLQDFAKTVSALVGTILLTTSNTLSTIIQIPIYIFLFLIYRGKFKLFFLSMIPNDKDELIWKKDVERVIQGYISGLMLVTLIVAALNTIGLLILGIEHAIFFGILSGVLTIIPYIGIFIGALFPVLMALITKDSALYAVGVIAVFTVVQFLEGNFITPRITGSKVSINALAAIVALIIGGQMLGIAGMILAVPAIGVLKIVLSYSTRLKPFVILLGDDDQMDQTKDPTEHTPPVQDLKRELKAKDPSADISKI